MAYRGAIFDLDGTLIDSTWVWEWVDHEFPKRLGVVLPEHYSEQIALLSPEEAAAYTIQTLGLDMPVDEMRAFWSGMGLELYQTKVKLKPGVKELLRDLKNKGCLLYTSRCV